MNSTLFLAAINGEALSTGGIIVLLGILVVFVILAMLIGILKMISPLTKIEYSAAIKSFFKKLFGKKTENITQISENEVAIEATSSEDEEVVAAIMAAISAINVCECERYEKQTKFVVRSIKQIR